MRTPGYRLAALALAAACAFPLPAAASVTRVSGPAGLIAEGRAFVKFDTAYDSINRIYLAVWGTQAAGPVNGLFLNESGGAIGGMFAVSSGPQQSGWARVLYSPEQRRFLVTYVKILAASNHQKVARFLSYANGAASLGPEIVLDTWIGDAGTATGIAYSTASGKFIVTWTHFVGPFSATFATTIDGNGTVAGNYTAAGVPVPISNTGDGQAEAEVACDPVQRRCLIVGNSWGAFLFPARASAMWARFIDDATAAPLGPSSFYITTWPSLRDTPGVVYAPSPGQFLVGFSRSGEIWGMKASAAAESVGVPFLVRRSNGGSDGVGYGFPSLRYNPGTDTTLITLTTFLGVPAVLEVDGNGAPVSGGFDLIPDVPDVASSPFDTRNQFTIAAANGVTKQFLVLDNHWFRLMRASVYSGVPSKPRVVKGDMDGDGRADPAVWRPSTGTFFWLGSSASTLAISNKQWGNQSLGDVTVSGDMDGDGRADLIVWRGSTGTWFWLTSSSGYDYAAARAVNWGDRSRGDVPLVADIDGDGKGELIVWRASDGIWYWLTSTSGYNPAAQMQKAWGSGLFGDVPVVSDFDGDGKGDLCVWRPTSGVWYWLTSSTNYDYGSQRSRQWGSGAVADQPLVGDLDGDQKADLVVWRPGEGAWYLLFSSTNYSYDTWQVRGWGAASLGDIPMLTDFDGDGRADITIWRASNGVWYWLTSTSGYISAAAQAFGGPGDVPLMK